MKTWRIVFTPQAAKDAKKLSGPDSNPKPKHYSTSSEKLLGDLAGAFSRRINIHHRLVHQVLRRKRIVKVIRMWTRYELG